MVHGFITALSGSQTILRLCRRSLNINLRASREGEENLENASRTRYGYDHIGLEVEDMEAAFKKLTNRGIHFINPPRDKGNKITAFFNGPDNISVELIQPLNRQDCVLDTRE